MPRAYARSNAPSIRDAQCTDGRTDGLTQNPLTLRRSLAFRNAHAHTTKSANGEKSDTCTTRHQRRMWAAAQIAGDRAKESA